MISCGLFYSLLISYYDSIYAFGYNGCGQLGIGTQDQRFPIKLTQE
jgi:alpha-tubulin suppressor-like RCC1 family protein